jgi:hypothetical protein
MCEVLRHEGDLGCPFGVEERRRCPPADRNAGYAPAVIVLDDLEDARSAGGSWLTVLLGFHVQAGCWALYAPPERDDRRLPVEALNATERVPGAIAAAQEWAARHVEDSDVERQEGEVAESGLPANLLAPVQVTEWRVVMFRGRPFYAPLCNVTPVCEIPVKDLLPTTGADCGCLPVIPDEGSGHDLPCRAVAKAASRG